jgi:hypothetical protein
LKISVNTTKAMTMEGKMSVRIKIMINDHITEEVNSFNYLGYTIRVTNNTNFEKKNGLTKYSSEHGNEPSGSMKCWEILK